VLDEEGFTALLEGGPEALEDGPESAFGESEA